MNKEFFKILFPLNIEKKVEIKFLSDNQFESIALRSLYKLDYLRILL